MKYPGRVQEIINTLVAQNRPLAEGSDDQRRALTRIIAEQIRFEFNPSWGTKSADSGRPPSKDAIAMQDGARLWAWDTINGSTRQPNQFPDAEDITGQHFIAVEPINHLGKTDDPKDPEDPKQPVDLKPILDRLDAAERKVAELGRQQDALQQQAFNTAAAQARIDAYLATRPIPNGGSASFFGVRAPLSLTFYPPPTQ